jgi:flagellar assembly factor FliW
VVVKVPEFEPFEWLVNVETRKLRFALINPMLFMPTYNPRIDKSQVQDLGLEKPEDVLLYAIVTLSKDPAQTTANLLGPVFINRTKRLGKQVILDDDRYSVKERILK